MADIRYRCPHCAAKLSVDEAAVGMEIRCPHCQLACTVPQPGPPGNLLSVDMRFRCPACDKKMSVDADHAGETTSCPGCRQPLTIPRLPEKEAPPAAPASVLSRNEIEFLTAQ